MRLLQLGFVVLVLALIAVPTSELKADVFAHNVRFTQTDSESPFDARFTDGTGVGIRFTLSDKADSVVVWVKNGSTVLATIKATGLSRGDNLITWDGTLDAGGTLGAGNFTVDIATYDVGYGTWTTIYDQDHGIFTRGATAIRNPALKAFGFYFTADNGGYYGRGTGVMRHANDGTEWGDMMGNGKVANTGSTINGTLRYGSEADYEGYVYLLNRSSSAAQVHRYHVDTMNIAMVDSGGYSTTVQGIGIRGMGAGRYLAIAGYEKIYGFLLGDNATYFGAKDWLVDGDSTLRFWDVTFGRDSMMYATYYFADDTTEKSGVAKFDLTGYTGTPLKLTDAVWKATVDSGRASTLTYKMGSGGESTDVIYFVNTDYSSTNPGDGSIGAYMLSNLDTTPTSMQIYVDVGDNNTQFRTDVAYDAVGNVIYFENTTENVAIISPPTGQNSYTYTAYNKLIVVVSEDIAAVRIDADNDYLPDRVGDTTTVIGIVNSINPTASSNRWQYYIQDATGGIAVTKGSETGGGPVYNIGDRIAVTGYVGAFNGLTQLNVLNIATDVQLLGTGFTVVPQVVTLKDLLADPESYESEYIQLNGVGITATSTTWPSGSANLTIWDGKYELTLRVDSDTDIDGSTEPVWPVNVKGPFIQFDGSDPRDGGYQIQPNFRADFTENVAVAPNPSFDLVIPADGSTITLADGFVQSFAWSPAVDLNGDALIYQFAPVGFSAVLSGNSGADTSLFRTGDELKAYLGAADSVVLRWTVNTKDAGPIVACEDTFTVTIKRGTITGVAEADVVPTEFALQQNFPNPFNPTTTIQVALPLASNMTLKVYNMLGQEVATLIDGFRSEGFVNAQWNGRDAYGQQVASGVYLYRVEANSVDGTRSFVMNRKMILMK